MSDSLDTITPAAFAAYNAGGPPDRANLTHDGKPVPPFDALGPSVRHKWTCASASAAAAGAELAMTFLTDQGLTIPPVWRERIMASLAAPVWSAEPTG